MRTISFRAFLIVSSLLLLLIFIGIATYDLNEREALFQQQLDRKARSLQQSFELTLSEQEDKMVLLASMIAADPVIQELFYHGSRMVEIEGGGEGGEEAARLRRNLYEHIAPAWQQMQFRHTLRQLHFHLPPAVSYLRVHAPENYGDDLSSLRQIIVNTNHDQKPQSGFEIGRINSGIRGAVPVWHSGQGASAVQVGSLEAGASFDRMLARLAPVVNAELALLLNQDQVEQAIWHEFKPEPISACNCYIESTTSDQIRKWLSQSALSFDSLSRQMDAKILTWQGRVYNLVHFPIQDYSGKIEAAARPPAGLIVAWQDISSLWHREQQSRNQFVLIIICAWILTQLLLLLLLRQLRAMMQKRVNAAAAEAEQAQNQLNSLLNDSPVVTYSVPVPGTAPGYISPNCEQLIGYASEQIMESENWWLERIHPHDREEVRQTLDWTRWPTRGVRRRYRVRHKNGLWRWVEDRCRATRSNDGQGILNGVLLDVTAQQRAEKALRESERSLRRTQQIAAVGSWEYHFPDQTLNWSEETYRIFAVSLEQVPDYALFIGRVHPDDREQVERAWHDAIEGKGYDIEHRILVGGETRWLHGMADFEHDETGILRAAGMVQDITGQKLREQELHRLATSDALTGLANRRYFMERMEHERARAARFKNCCGLMMIDLDYFKLVNDQYGHATGDRVLKAFATTATAQLRQIDTIGRIGGEEFAVLLPGTDQAGARILADRLRQAVAAIRFNDLESLLVTASIGVTIMTASDQEVDSPLSRADKAVYIAKANGRNRVEIFEP